MTGTSPVTSLGRGNPGPDAGSGEGRGLPDRERHGSTGSSFAARAGGQLLRGSLLGVGFVLGVGGLWELAKILTGTSDSLMPHTWQILASLDDRTSTGQSQFVYVAGHWLVTFRNSVVGFLIGATLGFALGIAIIRNRIVGHAIYPIAVLAQTIPIVAIAPALVLWLGTGVAAKVLIAAYLTFFPVTVATVKGIQRVPRESLELMRICAAKPTAVLVKMQVPAALPMIFVGLETAAGVAVVGAIVAELPFGSDAGIGLMILTSWQFYTIQPESLYVAVLASCLLGVVIVLAVRVARTLIPAANRPTDVTL